MLVSGRQFGVEPEMFQFLGRVLAVEDELAS